MTLNIRIFNQKVGRDLAMKKSLASGLITMIIFCILLQAPSPLAQYIFTGGDEF